MVDFAPQFTEVVFFDIECYVPPETRNISKRSMKYNPAVDSHFVLGGVFQRMFPLQNKLEPRWQVWNWNIEQEKDTLKAIYNYINDCWKLIENKKDNQPDLMLVGTGISRHDVPTLYIRSTKHCIDNAQAIFDTYFKTKIIDLTDVAIPLFKHNPSIYPIYPKPTNAILSRFKLQENGRKESGKNVWEMFESKEYEAIKKRTNSEVDDLLKMTRAIISQITSH